MNRLAFSLVAASLLVPISGGAAENQNWPQFRGANADGRAPESTRLPDAWSKTENVTWVTDVPGWGWSSPVVWGDRVFITSVSSDEENTAPRKGLYLGPGVRNPAKGVHHWLVHCFDLNTGELIWRHEAHTGRPVVPRHPKSSYAAETAATDGERVYVLFGDLGLFCVSLEGRPLWERRITPRKTMADYGAAASPVVHNGQVIVVYDNQENSYLASYDARTGAEQWRKRRAERSTWATPYIWRNGKRVEIVVCGKRRNRSYGLDGEELWEFDGNMSNLVIPSPFAVDGLLYIASGYVGDKNRPVFAVRPGASGDITLKAGERANEFIAWHRPQAGPYNPSPIVYRGRYYTLFDFGFLTCHDAKTGREVYGKTRFPGGRSSFTSSPLACGGKLYFLSEDGVMYVVQAGDEFKLLERNSVEELCLASPSISRNKLLIRTVSRLYCIGK